MPTRALLIATVTLLAAPAAAGAVNQLPVGEAHGVRIVQRGESASIVFTRRASGLWRQIAGKQIEVSCTQLPGPSSAGILGGSNSGVAQRAPKRRTPLEFGGRLGDYCTVALRYETDRMLSFDPVVVIPRTQAGAVALDEGAKTGELVFVLAMSGDDGDAGFLEPAEITRGLNARLLRRERLDVVALAAATDTPPAGKVGYWSDGDQRAAAVTLSSAGRRLYAELGPDDELHTNIARTLFSIDG